MLSHTFFSVISTIMRGNTYFGYLIIKSVQTLKTYLIFFSSKFLFYYEILNGYFVSCYFSRPVGIYKQDYINELYRRFNNDETDDPITAPPLPDWCELDDSSDLDDFDDIQEAGSTSL